MIALLVFIFAVAHGIDPSAEAVGIEDKACVSTGSQSLLQSGIFPVEKVLLNIPDEKALLADNGTYILPSRSQIELLAGARGRSETSSDIPAAMQEVLDLHNLYRCMHGAPLMVWDDTIAANAQAHVDKGVWGHSTRAERNLPGIGRVGENIAWGSPSRSGTDSTEAWYEEVALTDGTPENCNDRKAGASGAICHYTQVVWKASTKLGCGQGKLNNGDYWVCQYAAVGNVGGQFTDNVEGLSKTRQECEGVSPPPPPSPTPPPAPTPAPTLAPTPMPTLVEDTKDDDCVDKAAHENPIIYSSAPGPAECSDIAWACPWYTFVAAKCKFTCDSC